MAELDTNVTETVAEQTVEAATEQEAPVEESVEIARLRAELAKANDKANKATSEAAGYKKQLRAKQTKEEADAEEKRLADEERDRKLAEYEKRFTIAETSKKIMSFIGDENAANEAAGYLYGAEDTDAAVAIFQKAWTAKEKALRMEYGKTPAPGVGASEKVMTKEDIYNIKDPVARQDAIAANIALFGG